MSEIDEIFYKLLSADTLLPEGDVSRVWGHYEVAKCIGDEIKKLVNICPWRDRNLSDLEQAMRSVSDINSRADESDLIREIIDLWLCKILDRKIHANADVLALLYDMFMICRDRVKDKILKNAIGGDDDE